MEKKKLKAAKSKKRPLPDSTEEEVNTLGEFAKKAIMSERAKRVRLEVKPRPLEDILKELYIAKEELKRISAEIETNTDETFRAEMERVLDAKRRIVFNLQKEREAFNC